MQKRALLVPFVLCFALSLFWTNASAQVPDFIEFETGPVRPIAISEDGDRLYVTNIPDARLEIFDVVYTDGNEALSHYASVPVGMEPTAVAIQPIDPLETNPPDLIWVVNHLSDSVSVVDVTQTPPRVIKTLLVGDEPRDIVFTTDPIQAFITTAHRGQHRDDPSLLGVVGSGDAQLTSTTVGGIQRADVWVFDPASLGDDELGGVPVEILTFLSDTPRALAVDYDSQAVGYQTVYVAAFHSGNETTAVAERMVCNGFKPNKIDSNNSCNDPVTGGVNIPDRVSGPSELSTSEPAPETSVILHKRDGKWRDRENSPTDADWSSMVKFDLPDTDVFEIRADTLATSTTAAGVGTTLFNMAVNPISGDVFVSNNHANNHLLFSGEGDDHSTMIGMAAQAQISVIDPAAPTTTPVHLNSHLLYDGTDASNGRSVNSLSTPLDMVITGDGSTLYLAAYGSAKIGVFGTADLEDGSISVGNGVTGTSEHYIPTRPGPTGLALYEGGSESVNGWLFVLSRFDNTVSMFDLDDVPVEDVPLNPPSPRAEYQLYDRERPHIVGARHLLYDAVATSDSGEAACASCHVFGDTDHLAWNLGNPGATMTSANPQPNIEGIHDLPNSLGDPIHPLKGPMVTQTLRGTSNHGAMHWRGDRFFNSSSLASGTSGPVTDDCNEGTDCDEKTSLDNFIEAFETLLDRDVSNTPEAGKVSFEEMQSLSNFLNDIFLPPNPVRNLDNSLEPDEISGELQFDPTPTPTPLNKTCGDCHTLDPDNGFFGTSGLQAFVGKTQLFKVPHLRNLYTKVGMAGMLMKPNFSPGMNMGNQVRGFGFGHDGTIDTIDSFLGAHHFGLSKTERSQVEKFIMVFPTDLAPMVGQQVTLTTGNTTPATTRIAKMVTAAKTTFESPIFGTATECELIVKGIVSDEGSGEVARGWVFNGTGFNDDAGGSIGEAALRSTVTPTRPLTYTCVPPGSGYRMGIDRDNDTHLDDLDYLRVDLLEPPNTDPSP